VPIPRAIRILNECIGDLATAENSGLGLLIRTASDYSDLSAVIGSTLAARRAGIKDSPVRDTQPSREKSGIRDGHLRGYIQLQDEQQRLSLS
jgi:hypothetical protein